MAVTSEQSRLLKYYAAKQVSFFLRDGQLGYRAPEGSLSGEDISRIHKHKADIIAALACEGSVAAIPELVVQLRPDRLPLSCAQERLWLLDRLEQLGSAYNMPTAYRLLGPLDIPALQRSFAELRRRHESLRTHFIAMEGQVQQYIDSSEDPALVQDDLREPVTVAVQEEATARFDLRTGPLFRAKLLRESEQAHLLLMTEHHIIFDGWSHSVMMRELSRLYRGEVLPEPQLQYVDYALWQRSWLQGELLENQLRYWRERLSEVPTVLELPTDHPRPAVASFRGAIQSFRIPLDLTDRLRELAREEGATLFMVLLAAFQALLWCWTGQSDFVVGSPIAGRTHRQLENLVGFFVNTLALRARVTPEESFREYLRLVKESTLGAYAHQDLPFERLVAELRPQRDLSHLPLVQVLFTFHQAEASAMLDLPGIQVTPLYAEQTTAKFDLTLTLEVIPDGLIGVFEYAVDLFDYSTLERLTRYWVSVLEQAVSSPDAPLRHLDLLSTAERHQLIVEWNQTSVEYPRHVCVHDLFRAQARRTPEQTAVVCQDQSLTYAELERRSNQVAHYIREQGVGVETVVGLRMERTPQMLINLLGILKAGGTYLPLDLEAPPERLAYMLEDTKPLLVLSDQSWIQDEPAIARQPTHPPVCAAGPGTLAYLMYTSGSTGKPKGVMVQHRNIIRLVCNGGYASLAGESVLQMAPLTFDASTFEIWGALLNGGRCVLYPGNRPDLTQLRAILRQNRVTTLWLTAGLFAFIVEHDPDVLKGVRQLLAGGDALQVQHVNKVKAELPDCVLINGYGPTECTTFSVCHRFEETIASDLLVPIGRAIGNTLAYVLDQQLKPMPIGSPGELFIGGEGVARGYWRAPSLTAQRFLADPYGPVGQRMYRTGDRVRRRENGTLEFLGRTDYQVKIRGYRVELGEIEAALRGYGQLIDAVVLARGGEYHDHQLTAYLVPRPGCSLEIHEVTEYLKRRLPNYMVPAQFVKLESLPLTASGKVDRNSLPVPDTSVPIRSYVAPRTPLEEILARIWAEILNLERVGIDDHFFELGGHSLLDMKLIAKIWKELAVHLSVQTFFKNPTVRAMAITVGRMIEDQGACATVAGAGLHEEVI